MMARYISSLLLVLLTAQGASSFSCTDGIKLSRSPASTCTGLQSTSISTTTALKAVADRRAFFSNLAVGTAVTVLAPNFASASTGSDLVAELQLSKEKLAPIPDLLANSEWDKVRTILKTPPVNSLWNLGDKKNTLAKLADVTGEVDLYELKDELSISLQMCDQLTYDNGFVYYQPGNGKINLKEPTILANKAMTQIQDGINMSNAAL